MLTYLSTLRAATLGSIQSEREVPPQKFKKGERVVFIGDPTSGGEYGLLLSDSRLEDDLTWAYRVVFTGELLARWCREDQLIRSPYFLPGIGRMVRTDYCPGSPFHDRIGRVVGRKWLVSWTRFEFTVQFEPDGKPAFFDAGQLRQLPYDQEMKADREYKAKLNYKTEE